MRRLPSISLVFLLLVFLAGCAPGVMASLERINGDVIIRVDMGSVALDIVGLVVIGDNLSTIDGRCDDVDGALSCDLGDLPAGSSVTVVVSGDMVSCIVTGYAGVGLTDYRIRRCLVT